MSGFEVAGIALSAFPVVIDGISHFVEGVRTIKYWRRYRLKLQGFAAIIKAQRVCYLDTLEELLADMVESEEDLNLMICEPGGLAWQRPEYDLRLRQRLDRSYDVFLKTINTMVENLNLMCRKLGVNQHGDVLWDELSVVDREMKRLKITLSKNVYQDSIENIEKANRDLREITRQNLYLEPIRKTRKSKRIISGLKLIRKHAASVYQAIVTGKAWKCQCRDYHQACLRLELRPSTTKEETLQADFDFKFRILLSNTLPSQLSTMDIRCRDIEVRPFIGKTVDSNASPKVGAGAKKGVRFAVASSTQADFPVASHYHAAARDKVSAIADICDIMWKSPQLEEAIGFLTDEHDGEYKHFLYRANTFTVDKPQSRSLREVLCEIRTDSPSGTLRKRERLEIAIILASSFLQLDGTSWLSSRWSSNDIYFHTKSGEQQTSLMYPYLPWHQCTGEDSLTSATQKLTIGSHIVRSENLFALGLALIELCFGRPLSLLHKPEDYDSSNAATDSKCALRLLEFVYDEMDDVYGDVVRRCLYQPFDVRDMSLENEDVQQKVYSDIVAPLIENLNNFKGKSRIR